LGEEGVMAPKRPGPFIGKAGGGSKELANGRLGKKRYLWDGPPDRVGGGGRSELVSGVRGGGDERLSNQGQQAKN